VETDRKSLKISEKALAVAIEALSLVDLEEIGFRAAVDNASLQLQIRGAPLVREARRLVFETLSRKNVLDIIIKEAVAPAVLDDFKFGVKAFLRIFTYATKFSADLEPVHLAWLGRRILGWKELIPAELALGRISTINVDDIRQRYNDDEGTALRTSNPLWFVKYCTRIFGRTEALRLLSFHSPRGRTFVSLNVLRTNESEILEELKSREVILEPLHGIPNVYEVTKAEEGLRKWILTGKLRLQDLPSTLAVTSSNPCSGRNILFVGASPIAPIIYAAQLMMNQGTLLVLDSSKERLSKVLADTSSAGISIVTAEYSENFDISPDLRYEQIILNAPSSRTGVFWREPSLKWRSEPNAIEYFSDVQMRLLDSCSEAVCGGGDLTYWTRSVAVEENELVVEHFLSRHAEFVLSETTPRIGVSGIRGQRQSQRLFPHLHFSDGAFIAHLTKLGSSN
jgi:16S rRNA (cytosine967-C5)-methyltransferase